MEFLKNHPFAVAAFFESSLVLTFAVPKEQLEHLIPGCLTLDTFQDKWAFVAVAMVQTSKLRPKGLPEFMGNDFFLIGYRIFVRYTDNRGKRLRGLFVLRSETDKKKMAFLGNIFTHYRYAATDIRKVRNGRLATIISEKSGFHIVIEEREGDVNMPESSPFSDWKDARKFSGPLPFSFTYNKANNTVVIIEGVRQNWKPKLVNVLDYKCDFLSRLKLQDALLASAFEVKDVPYYWKKGKIEKWQ